MTREAVPPFLRSAARRLRRDMTDAEAKLWAELRGRRLDGIKFRRRTPVGPFVVDFVCFEAGLIVEVDGSQHAESAKDRMRDADLARRGFQVLRFWNHEVLGDLDGVCQAIFAIASERITASSGASRHLLPRGEKDTPAATQML